MSQKTPGNDYKSTNVKLTTKKCSLTTMTIENRRFSFISAILSLSPRHGHSSLETGSKRYTSSRKSRNSKWQQFFCTLKKAFTSFSRRFSLLPCNSALDLNQIEWMIFFLRKKIGQKNFMIMHRLARFFRWGSNGPALKTLT